MKKLMIFVAAIILIGLLVAGYMIPMGEYVSAGSCVTDGPIANKHLHYIAGDRLETYQNQRYRPIVGEGCSLPVRYQLFFL